MEQTWRWFGPNDLTFCVGSYGVRADNDLVAVPQHFAARICLTHLRSTERKDNPLSFHEADHTAGDVDIVAVISALVLEERRRDSDGGPRIRLRPDQGTSYSMTSTGSPTPATP